MQLISKNNKYKQVKRFQGGNIIQRDNTRMVSKPEPRLKEEPQLPTQIQSNQTFLSPMPNRSAALDEQAKVNAIKNEAYNNLERTKYANFWTAPYAGFSGKQAFDLGTNLVKESTYTAAGEILLPLLGKAASKGISKIMPKKRFNINGFSGKVTKTTDEASIMAEQDKAFKEGIEEVVQEWNGSPNLSNYELVEKRPVTSKYRFKLNPDIQKRMEASGFKVKDNWMKNQIESKWDDVYLGLFDNKDASLSVVKGEPTLATAKRIFKENPNYTGFHFNDGDNYPYEIVLKRRDSKGKLLKPEEIKSIANHEAAHLMQRIYGFKPNLPDEVIKVPTMDSTTPLGQKLFQHVNHKSNWALSGLESDAEAWRFRMKKGIGARNFTDEEAKEFINFRDDLWQEESVKKPSLDFLKGIKMLPSFLPFFTLLND